MPVPVPPRSRPLLRARAQHPWSQAARHSPALRKWCDRHGYITPHFSWASYACMDRTHTPVPGPLRANAIKLHWLLEDFRHELGDVAMTVDGPYRTVEHNREVGGAQNSRHMHADAADFFVAQVERWAHVSHKTIGQIVATADRIFVNGGLGNENSGTLHVDARGYRSRFVTWVASR